MKSFSLTVIAALMSLSGLCAVQPGAAQSAGKTAGSAGYVSLVSARKLISRVIKNPKAMGIVMKRLSPQDQVSFLGEVNQSIAGQPASPEKRAATFLNVNSAALKAAHPGNLGNLVAEVFATVPLESLTVVNEGLADNLFNRAADPATTYTDEQYLRIAKSLMEKISERTAKADNAAARDTFAAMMLQRASNGSMPDLAKDLVQHLPEGDRNKAVKEWIPAASGNTDARYEQMLSDTGAEVDAAPRIEQSLWIAGPQMLDALLKDLKGGNRVSGAESHERTPILDAITSEINNVLPGGGAPAGSAIEPGGYQWQTTK